MWYNIYVEWCKLGILVCFEHKLGAAHIQMTRKNNTHRQYHPQFAPNNVKISHELAQTKNPKHFTFYMKYVIIYM